MSRLRVKTVFTFEAADFDRLLDLSHPNGLRIIAPATGVSRASSIALHVVPDKATLHMSYYPINADGSDGRSIRTWWENVPPEPEYMALIIGDDEPEAILTALAALGRS